MVAADGEDGVGSAEVENFEREGAFVDEIAGYYHALVERFERDVGALCFVDLGQQQLELMEAAVDVADDVEL